MAWVTGYPDGPPVLVRGAGDPIAAMHAVVAVLLALEQRDGDGKGRLIESTMVEAVLNVAVEQVIEFCATGTVLARAADPGQQVLRCAGDDEWVAVASSRPDLRPFCAARRAEDAAAALIAEGVAAAVVIPARDIVRNPQLQHRRLFEDEDHPVTGRHALPGLPFRFSRVDRWARRPSPTLGQHNEEILTELGLGDDVGRLEERGVIGTRLAR
jgi:crotonobetainyl-CoA:carnitine CoA-transferase CaiB-like acyl-CoA transferase